MATIDELDAKVRELASEVEGEKTITRHILHETRQNSGELATIKAQLMHMAGDVVVMNAAVGSLTRRVDGLAQDVTLLRNDVTQLRRDMEDVHTRLDGMDRKLDGMASGIAAIRGAVAPREPPGTGS
jgi:uncharacterized protein YoxC